MGAATSLQLLSGLTADIWWRVEAPAGSWQRSAGKAHVLGLKIDLNAAALSGLRQSKRPLFFAGVFMTTQQRNSYGWKMGRVLRAKTCPPFILFMKKFTPAQTTA